jgi:hypothetical protein
MNITDTNSHAHARRLIAAAVGAGILVVAGGGVALATTVPVDTAPQDSAAPADTMAAAEPVAIAVTVTEAGIEGLPDDLVAGVVDITVADESGAAIDGEVDFTLVEPGTDVATFTEGLPALVEGGPFPDFFLNNVGAVGHTVTTLDAGEYIVWAELASDDEEAPGTIVAAPLTVGEGDDAAVIPATDGGVILGGDYLFDADVTAGGTSVTFTNPSDNQFHHVVLMDFGTNDPATVEANLPAFLAEEEGAPPEGIDMEQVNFEFASSPIFGPGSSGTFEAPFEAGHTYVALCFIHDREGGLPHALQHGMYDVFQVD